MDPDPERSGKPSPSDAGGLASAAWRHRVLLSKLFVAALLVVIVLQNLEPTRVDLLFWSLPQVPKLVMILVSMAVGAGVWELVRRALASARDA